MLPGIFVKPDLPRRYSPIGLGWWHLLGYLWGVSPNTVSIPCACDTAQKCFFQSERGDWEAAIQVLPVSSGPRYLPAQEKGRAGSQLRVRRCPDACSAPFLPSLFWDLRARCYFPALCFHTIFSLGSAQGLRAGLSPKKRHRPAWGWADVPLPGMQGPARCHPHTGQGQHTKGPSWKAQFMKHKNKVLFPVVKLFSSIFSWKQLS